MQLMVVPLAVALLLPLLVGGRAEAAPNPRRALSISVDLNGDGRHDQATAAADGLRVQLSRSHGGGRLFIPLAHDIVGLAAGDIDEDGDADLVALRSSGQLIVCRNDSGRFTTVIPRTTGSSMAAGQPTLSAPAWDPSVPFESASRRGFSSGGLPGECEFAHLEAKESLSAPCSLVPLDPVVRRRSPRSPPVLSLA